MSRIELTPAMFVQRILVDLKSFVSGKSVVDKYFTEVSIPSAQTILGVYENNRDSIKDAVVITDTSVWLVGTNRMEETRYLDVEPNAVTWEPESKREANSIRIELRDKTTKLIPIRGKDPNDGSDVFEFVRFFVRTCAAARDAKKT